MKRGPLLSLRVIVAVATAAAFGPILSNGYTLPEVEDCVPDNELFQPFHAYSSHYAISGKGSMSSVANQVVGFNVTCDLTIYVAEGCRYSMKVQSCVRVDEGETDKSVAPKHHLVLDMLSYPVFFSMSDGKVEKLAAHKAEPVHVLNFKRGIISSILVKNSSESVQKHGHQKSQWRSDVHGTCPTQYRKSDSVITLTKKMSECNFPQKTDWSHSPWSMFWNMNFLQKLAMDSKVHCQYSRDSLLPSVKCAEEHTMRLRLTNETGSDFQTIITQEFVALEAKPLTKAPEVVDEDDFRLVDIQYEHERDVVPAKNPEDLQAKAVSLLEELVIDGERPIDLDATSRFEELVDLLRQSADLKDLTLGLPSCWNSQKCRRHPAFSARFNDFKLQMAQTWRDALVHCNRLPCFRGLRILLTMNQDFLDDVITGNYLNMVFLSWANLNVPSIDFFPEMLKMCKLRSTRPCLLSLTTAVHEFWRQNKNTFNNTLPSVFREIVQYISLPIGANCENSQTFTNVQIMVSLVAIANLGEVAELAIEELPRRLHACAINGQLYWPISVLAIQAQWRFRPTDALHERLLIVFRNSAARQDFRAAAYEILRKNWGDEQLVREVTAILVDEGENFNLKTFLVSGLRADAKSREPSKAKYAESIRAAMDENPEKFRLRTDRYVSKHVERHFRFSAPLPEQPEDGFGYSFSEAILRNPETFLPYSLTDALQVELFGKTFDLYEVYGNSRGMMKSYEVFLSYFFNMDRLNLTEAAQSVVKLLNIAVGRQKKPELINRFAYPVDDNIFQNLLRIRKGQMASLAEAFSGEHAAIFKLKLLGDVLGFTTSDLLQEDIYDIIQSWVVPPIIPSELPIFTSRSRILEAAHHVPTLGGLPLKLTLDSFFVLSLKEKRQFSYLNPHYRVGFNFSSIATLQARMLLDFPGQTSFGVQTLTTSASSLGANVKFMHSFAKKTLNISVELPQRPLHWLSLTRQHSVFQKSEEEAQSPHVTTSDGSQWCHRRLLPQMGTQWCQSSSGFRHRGRHASRSWFFTGQSSNWNLTTALDPSHHRTFELNLHINRGADVSTENFGIDLRAIDPRIPNKFMDIATYRHDWHKGRDEHRIEFRIPQIPHLNCTAVKRSTDLGSELLASVTVLPNRTFAIHYLTKVTQEQGSEGALRYPPTSGFQATRTLPVEYHVINITTPTEYYSWTYSQRRYPQTFVADLEFGCHSFRLQDAQWLQRLMSTDSDNRLQTLGLAFHHESLYLIENLTLPSLPHLSYNHLKAPSSILELETFSGSLPTGAWAFWFNLTQRHLPSKQLTTFLNFGTTADFGKEVGVGLKSSVYDTRVDVPACSLVARVELLVAAEKNVNCSLFFRKIIKEYQPSTRITIKTDPILLNIHFGRNPSKAGDEKPSREAEQTKYSILGNLTYGPEVVTAQYVLEHAEDFSRLAHKSLMESSALKLRWEATADADLLIPKSSVRCRISRTPHGDTLATYSAALSLSPDNTLGFQSSLESEWYSSKSRLSYQASADKGLSLDVYVKANSSIWGIGSMTLKHTMAKSTVSTTFESQLLEYGFRGSWDNQARGAFHVKSKNLEYVPNMIGNAEYSSLKGSFLQLSLPDVPRDIFLINGMSPHRTEMRFMLCFDRHCKDTTRNPGSFLGKLLFTLVEEKDLATTLIYNKQFGKLIKLLIRARFGTKKQDSNALQGANSGRRPSEVTIGQLLGPILSSLQQDAKKIFSGFSSIPESLAPINDQVFGTMARVSSYAFTESSLAKLLHTSQLTHLYHRHDLNRRLPPWISWGISSLALGMFSVPGERSENTYSITVPLPMTGWKFGTYPAHPNPAFYRLLHTFWPLTSDPSPAGRLFHVSWYTRVALFVGQGNVYTFDGRPLPLEQALSPGCAYLLSHDFELQKFTVYFQDQKFHFLLADTSLVLAQSGAVAVNGTPVDLPLEHWNGEFCVSRQENLVEVDTKYNLKVVCDVDAIFCVFYTNAWKFNQLIGLLGNNNDNPGDDIKRLTDNRFFKETDHCIVGTANHPAQYELTRSGKCGRKEEDLPASVPSSEYVCNTFSDASPFLSSRSPTFLCHDIVPSGNFRYVCKYCSRSPCATVKAYLALCGSQAVPVGHAPVSCDSCNGHDRGTEWTAKVTNKVEVVFLVDQGQHGKKFVKGLGILATSIDTKFAEFGYTSVLFGIVGFRGGGFRSGTEQHTLNNKLLGSLTEFRLHGLKSLKFTGPEEGGSSVPFDAITYAANHYSLDPRARHVFILVTQEDPTDIIYAEAMYRAQQAMSAHQVALYVFSNYNNMAKRLWRFSVQSHTSDQEEPDSTGGQYSRVASASNGALWQLSHLEDGSHQEQVYLDTVAEEMLIREQQEVGRCRKCVCAAPGYYKAQALCHEAPCSPPGRQ